jgi:hypothetical protein
MGALAMEAKRIVIHGENYEDVSMVSLGEYATLRWKDDEAMGLGIGPV